MSLITVLCGMAGLSCGGGGERNAGRIVVYAAASTTELINSAAAVFNESTGIEVGIEFSSSGSLARKIEAGSPTDVFISASQNWIEYAQSRMLLEPGSTMMFARNSLVFVEPTSTPSGFGSPEDLAAAERICIGDPEHVPAGRYARQSLQHYGLWDELMAAGKIVLAINVRAAMSQVEQGEVTGGIVYSTDATLSGDVHTVFTLPDDSHTPITYHAGIVAGSTNKRAAGEFIDFMTGEQFAGLIQQHGFRCP